MRAGDLRDRVTLLVATTTVDTHGASSLTWAELSGVSQVWASVTPSGAASERIEASAMTAVNGYRVVMRYRTDVTPTMRLQWRPYRSSTPMTLEIRGVSEVDGGREFLAAECSVVKA